MKTFFLHNLRRSTSFWIKTAMVFIIALVTLFLPVKIPISVSAIGKIYPVKELIVSREDDGQLSTNLTDYSIGAKNQYSLNQFEREGTVRFRLNDNLIHNQFVASGDTIGTIYSSETEEQLITLKAELKIVRAELKSGRAGDKESLILEAENNLEYAKIDADRQNSIFEQYKKLRESELVSQDELDAVENEFKLKSIQIEIAASQLKAVQSGMTDEGIEIILANIGSLEQQIEMLEQRKKSFSVISPINGVITRTYSSDTIMAISDTSDYIAVIPILLNAHSQVNIGQIAQIKSGLSHIQLEARIISIDKKVHVINGREIVFATARIDNSENAELWGMQVNCQIECSPITPLNYLERLFSQLMV